MVLSSHQPQHVIASQWVFSTFSAQLRFLGAPLAMLSMPSLSLFWPPSPSPAISAFNLSKGKSLIHSLQHLNWGIPWYVHIDIIDTCPSLVFSMLGHHDFVQNRWVLHCQPFWCILMFSNMFTAISILFLMLCMSVYMLNTFVGFLKLFGLSGPASATWQKFCRWGNPRQT